MASLLCLCETFGSILVVCVLSFSLIFYINLCVGSESSPEQGSAMIYVPRTHTKMVISVQVISRGGKSMQ